MSVRLVLAVAMVFAAAPLTISPHGLSPNYSAAAPGAMSNFTPNASKTFGNGMEMRQMGPNQMQNRGMGMRQMGPNQMQNRGMGMRDGDFGADIMHDRLGGMGRGRHGGTGRGGGMR